MNNPEQGSPEPEQELTREKRLEIAKNLASLYYEDNLSKLKKELEKSEADIRKKLHLASSLLFIDAEKKDVKIEREFLKKSKNGDFFSRTSLGPEWSIYYLLKRNLNAMFVDIEDLKKEKGNQNDPEVKEFQEEERRIRSIVEAIEATEEFKEFSNK